MSAHAERRAGAALPSGAVSLMLLLCAIWGLNMVAVKTGNAGIPPVLQAGLRSVVSGALLLGWSALRGVDLRSWRHDGTLLWGVLAGAIFALEFVALYIGIGWTTASRAIIFLYGAPFFVAAGMHAFVPEDRLTPAKLAGLATAFGGLLLAFAEGLSGPEGWRALAGDALCLAGGAAWAAVTVIVKATPLRRAAPEVMLLYQLLVSAPLLLLAAPLFGPLALAPTPLVIAAFIYQSVGIAFVSYTAWFWLVSRHSASRLSAFSFLTPIFGVLAGALLLGEPLGPLFAGGAVLVAAGLWLVNRP